MIRPVRGHVSIIRFMSLFLRTHSAVSSIRIPANPESDGMNLQRLRLVPQRMEELQILPHGVENNLFVNGDLCTAVFGTAERVLKMQ